MQSDKVLNLPAGYFGIVLGTIGMGFAWRYASQVWQVSHWLGDGLVILAMIIWGLLTGAFITRLIRFPHSVLAEVRHPVLSSFVSLFPATTMLVAIGFVPWFRPLAVCLFSFGGVPVQFWRCACSVLVSWFSWLMPPGSWFSWLMPPGKLRDYGADLTLKKLPRLDCICRQLPTTLSAQWPVVRWATPTPVWCF